MEREKIVRPQEARKEAEQENAQIYIGQLRTAVGADAAAPGGEGQAAHSPVQAAANQTPQVQQLMALQAGANQSPQVAAYRAHQEGANQSSQVHQYRRAQNAANQRTPVQRPSGVAPIQARLRIQNSNGARGPRNFTAANVNDIDLAVGPFLASTGWSPEFQYRVLQRLRQMAMNGRQNASFLDWKAALQNLISMAGSLPDIGISQGHYGEPGSEHRPFPYVQAGPARNRLRNPFDQGRLPWTHNSSPHGLVGIMLTGVIAPGPEASVNFRYDIDNRYHQGVTIVMKPGLYASFRSRGAWIEDLYAQHTPLGYRDDQAISGIGSGDRMRKVQQGFEPTFFNALTQASDFRSNQVAAPGGMHSGRQVPIIASHNPQLRVPAVVGIAHIDFIIMTGEAWDMLSGLLLDKDNHGPARQGATDFRRHSSQSANIPLPGYISQAVRNLRTLANQGGILVDGRRVNWAHEAGRVRNRDANGKRQMTQAANSGLEATGGFGRSIGENNSPSALGMESFERFQGMYYARLAQRNNATGRVAEAILRRAMPTHVYEADANLLIYVNNCLINAICNAAHGRNATLAELTVIRAALNNVGEMMAATPMTIDVICGALEIPGRGVMVMYPVSVLNAQDEQFGGGNPITVYHTGAAHFQHFPPPGIPYRNQVLGLGPGPRPGPGPGFGPGPGPGPGFGPGPGPVP
jgi:hypothetical protein